MIYGLHCTCHPEKGVRYVGQTRRGVEKRLYGHLWDSGATRKRMRDFNVPVHNWIRKHTPENIRAVVIEAVDPDCLDERETFWISQYRMQSEDLLNVHDGGMSRSGWSHTGEARERISQAVRSRPGGNRTLQDLSDVPGIRDRVRSGESYASISRDLNIGYSVVSGIARGVSYARVGADGLFDATLPRESENIANGHGSHRKIDDSAVEMLESGMTHIEVAKEFGVTPGAVANYVFRKGLPQRRPRISRETEELIIATYLGQTPPPSLRWVGRQTGINHVSVSRVLKSAGLVK